MWKTFFKALVFSTVVLLLSGSAYASVVVTADDRIDSKLIAKDSEYKLVFFGYAGCYHFCDPRLREINPIYEALKKSLDIKMLFVDISESTTLEAAQKFAKAVNSDFEAINPDKERLQKLHKQFKDIFIQKMPDGEYLHSGFLYLLKRYKGDYYLIKLYPDFQNTEAVIMDIKEQIRK